jgi:hypothetical protein
MYTRITGSLAGLLIGGANNFGATALVAAASYGLGCIAASLRSFWLTRKMRLRVTTSPWRMVTAAGLLGLSCSGCAAPASTTQIQSPQASLPSAIASASTTIPATSAPTLSVSTESPAQVPTTYQSQYSTLQGHLASFASIAGSPSPGSPTVLASSLEFANANTLTPNVLQGNALANSTAMIQAMKALGETGVTVQVNFPLLVTAFPDSATYTSFYSQIAATVHAAGMTLIVEANPLFENISSLPVSTFYAGLTLQSLEADYQQQTQTIINVMAPSYVTILTEPDTDTALFHNSALDISSPAIGVQFVKGVLAGLDRKGTKVGAGTGSWQDATYDQSLLSGTGIDFLDMHTFPIGPNDLANMAAQVAAAKTVHMPIVMTECWLYKQTLTAQPGEGVTGAPNEQKVETYSFWEPLDSEFVNAMVTYARSNDFAAVSPFPTENFFAYQAWTPTLDAEPGSAVRASFNRQVLQAMRTGQISQVGETVLKLAG